jgi:hypothetical protein
MSKARMAADVLGRTKDFLFGGLTKEDLLVRLGMDAIGGGMAAMYTPGDLGDKAIAGISSTIGGVGGGLVAGRLAGNNQLLGTALDFGGSVLGDMAASRVGEEVMKGKSYLQGEGYLNPWEKMSNEQQAMLAQEMERSILAQYGLAVPGAPIAQLQADPTMGVLGA